MASAANVIKVEPSKSSRASCRFCKEKIAKGVLRFGTTGMYGMHVTMTWRHATCVDVSNRTTGWLQSLGGYGDLSQEHQATLLSMVGKPRAAPAASAGVKRSAPSPAATSSSSSTKRRKVAATSSSSSISPAPSAKRRIVAAAAAATKPAAPGAIREAAPLEKGVCLIEYAKVKKPSPCRNCRCPIANGEPRVGTKEDAWAFEGLQTRWLCLRCAEAGACGGIQRITQLKGWDRMGYDCNVEIRRRTGELLDAAQEAALKRRMESLEGLQSLLCENLSTTQMIEALKINGIDAAGALTIGRDSIAQSVILSDGIAHGLPEDCPVCNNSSLAELAGRISCLGYIDGLAKCVYKTQHTGVKRYRFKLTPALLQADFLIDWRRKNGSLDEVAAAKAASSVDVEKVNKLKVHALKAQLKALGLRSTGAKSVLRDRLVAAMTTTAVMKATTRPGKGGDGVVTLETAQWTSSTAGLKVGAEVKNLKSGGVHKVASIQPSGLVNIEDCPGVYPLASFSAFFEVRVKPTSKKGKGKSKKKGKLKIDGTALRATKGGSTTKSTTEGAEAPPPKRPVPHPKSEAMQVHEAHMQSGFPPHRVRVVTSKKNNDVFSAMLTQTNLAAGINRFYVVQCLALDKGTRGYHVLTHFGKIGSRLEERHYGGWMSCDNFKIYEFFSESEAIACFKKWFQKKTGNEWDKRHLFKQRPTFYGFVPLSCANPTGGSAGGAASGATQACSLSSEVKSLVELMFDQDSIVETLETLSINTDEMPLGKITAAAVAAARATLAALDRLLVTGPTAVPNSPVPAPAPASKRKRRSRSRSSKRAATRSSTRRSKRLAAGQKTEEDAEKMDVDGDNNDATAAAVPIPSVAAAAEEPLSLGTSAAKLAEDIHASKVAALSTKYYSQIPTKDPKMLSTRALIRDKMQALDILADIAFAQDLTKDLNPDRASSANSTALPDHPTDARYKTLSCGLNALPKTSPAYEAIAAALASTSVPNVGYDQPFLCGFQGTSQPKLVEVFEINRNGADARFAAHDKIQNRMLLWHGTGVSVAAAIVKQGLRIMPGTYGRVGSGLYFASEACKSGHYVKAAPDGSALLFVAEVALGKSATVTTESSHLQAAPVGFDSVVALGRHAPPISSYRTIRVGGRDVPIAAATAAPRLVDRTLGGKEKKILKSTFLQDEFLVYKADQARLRFVVRVRV